MTDRELLEKAAKAAGIEILWHEEGDEPWCFIPDCRPPHNRRERDKYSGVIWNPLEDDGDALRLAVKLRIQVRIADFDTMCHGPRVEDPGAAETHGDYADPYAATRRAIVRVAAAIGDAA